MSAKFCSNAFKRWDKFKKSTTFNILSANTSVCIVFWSGMAIGRQNTLEEYRNLTYRRIREKMSYKQQTVKIMGMTAYEQKTEPLIIYPTPQEYEKELSGVIEKTSELINVFFQKKEFKDDIDSLLISGCNVNQ